MLPLTGFMLHVASILEIAVINYPYKVKTYKTISVGLLCIYSPFKHIWLLPNPSIYKNTNAYFHFY